MRMQEIKIYKFKELSKEAQEKAIERHRNDQEIDLDWFECETIEMLKAIGIYDEKVYYSLSYSQSDYFSVGGKGSLSDFLKNDALKDFSKKIIELHTKTLEEINSLFAALTETEKEYLMENTMIEKTVYGGRCCSGTFKAHLNEDDFDFDDKTKDFKHIFYKIEESIERFFNDFEIIMKKKGYEIIEYESSDEAIRENIILNEYEFLEDGEMSFL